jgi:hypothetical protein
LRFSHHQPRRPDDLIKTNVYERIQKQFGSRFVSIRECRSIQLAIAAEQFIAEDLYAVPIYGLSSNKCFFHKSVPKAFYRPLAGKL